MIPVISFVVLAAGLAKLVQEVRDERCSHCVNRCRLCGKRGVAKCKAR